MSIIIKLLDSNPLAMMIIKLLDSNTLAMAVAFFKQQYNYVIFTTYLIFPQNWMDWSKKIATALIKVS